MNPISRFREFISFPSHGRTWTLLAFLILVLAIPLTVNIAQRQQEIRQQAACQVCPNGGSKADDGNCWGDPSTKTGFSGPAKVCPNAGPTGATCPAGTSPTCSQGTLNFFNDGTYICSNNVPPNCTPSAQQPQQPSAPTSTPSAGAGDCRCRYIPAADDNICTDSQGRTCDPNVPATTNCVDSNCPLGNFCQNNQCVTVPNQIACSTQPTCPAGYVVNGPWNGKWACSNNTVTGPARYAIAPDCPTQQNAPPPVAPAATCDASKGFISACTASDSKTAIPNTSCNRVCPAGTARAGQTVQGISYKQCQNLCWYDSYYDKTQSKIDQGKTASNGPGWCFPVPGTTDPCTVSSGAVCTCNAQGGDAVAPNNGFRCTDAPNTLRFCASNEKCVGPSTLPNFPCQVVSNSNNKPSCNLESNPASSPCQANQNTCNGVGTRQPNFDRLQGGNLNGGDCNPRLGDRIACSVTPATNNCSSSNCQNGPGPSGTCVAQSPATPGVVSAGNIELTFVLKLDGLGTLGDRDTGSQKNNPARRSRTVSAVLIDSAGNKRGASGTLNPSNLSATVTTIAGNLQNGTYTLLVKADGFLQRRQGTSFTLETGKNNPIGLLPVSLPNGNINNDVTVSASDYELLRACYGKTISGDCAKSDLDDDQQITLFDLNLLLREFGLNDEI